MDAMDILPRELIRKCSQVVHQAHRRSGMAALPAKISFSHPKNMLALASMAETTSLLKRAAFYARARMICKSVVLILPILAWFYGLWLLSGIVIIVAVERILAKREREGWMFLSSVLLCLEMLIHDFSGWGRAHPEARKKADEIYGKKIIWLDYYLPRRDRLDPAALKNFGPV